MGRTPNQAIGTTERPSVPFGVDPSNDLSPVNVDADGNLQNKDVNLNAVFGIPDVANMGTLGVSSSDASVALDADSVYLLIADVDVYFHLTDGSEAATNSSLYLPSDQYIAIRTGSAIVNLHAIQKSSAGTLHYCKMQ